LPTIDNAQLARSSNVPLPSWRTPLVESPSAPLLAAGEHDGQRAVWVGFNPLDSTWPLRVSFPIFIANAMDWLSPEVNTSLRAGESFAIRMADEESTVTVTLPDGSEEPTQTTANGELIFANTFQQGVYRAVLGTNELSFCVNLLDANESAIEPRKELQLGEYGRVEATVQLDADKEAWRWIAMLCLGFLMFEWWFYHRRTA
ncbi:MAG: hypothetical protein OXS32_05045, partial [Verrucomicrobiales bacterium]|nr:hypothetical protein [Verrucomicrobiales bacterium]